MRKEDYPQLFFSVKYYQFHFTPWVYTEGNTSKRDFPPSGISLKPCPSTWHHGGIEVTEMHLPILSSFTLSEFSNPWKPLIILAEVEQTTKMNWFSSCWYIHTQRHIIFAFPSACLDSYSYYIWTEVALFTNPFNMKSFQVPNKDKTCIPCHMDRNLFFEILF